MDTIKNLLTPDNIKKLLTKENIDNFVKIIKNILKMYKNITKKNNDDDTNTIPDNDNIIISDRFISENNLPEIIITEPSITEQTITIPEPIISEPIISEPIIITPEPSIHETSSDDEYKITTIEIFDERQVSYTVCINNDLKCFNICETSSNCIIVEPIFFKNIYFKINNDISVISDFKYKMKITSDSYIFWD